MTAVVSFRRWWILLAMVLFVASVSSYRWILTGTTTAPLWLEDPIATFVGPGTAIWWLTLGGPYQVNPSSPGGIAWAAAYNTLFWSLAALLLWAIVGWVHRWTARR